MAIKKNVIYPAQDFLLYLLPVSAAPWNRDFSSVKIRSECSLPTHLHAVSRRPYFYQEESLAGATTVFVVPEAWMPSPCVGIRPKKALTEPEPLTHDTWRWSEREASLSAFRSYLFGPWCFSWDKWQRHSLPVPGSHLVSDLPGDWDDLLIYCRRITLENFQYILNPKPAFRRVPLVTFLPLDWLVSQLFYVSLLEHLASGGGLLGQFSLSRFQAAFPRRDKRLFSVKSAHQRTGIPCGKGTNMYKWE